MKVKDNNISALSGVRFYLFLLVIWSHMPNYIPEQLSQILPLFQTGSFAVTFFFILSGFCITLGYLDKFKDSLTNYCDFIKKRFLKIYPLYFLTGLAFFHGLKWLLEFVLLYIPMLQVYTAKYVFFANGAGWFVADLFFCYLLCPFLLLYLNRINKLRDIILSCAVPIILLGIMWLIFRNCSDGVYFVVSHIPFTRFLVFACGVSLAYIYKKYLTDRINLVFDNYWIKSFTDLLLISLCIFSVSHLKYGVFSTLVISTLLILFTVLYLCITNKSLLNDLLNSKISLWLASISMECYLIHYVLIIHMKRVLLKYCYNYTHIIYSFLIILVLTIMFSFIYKHLQNKIYTKFKIM